MSLLEEKIITFSVECVEPPHRFIANVKVCDNLWKFSIEHFVFYANVRQKVVIESKIAVGDKRKLQKLRRYQILLSLRRAAGHGNSSLELY